MDILVWSQSEYLSNSLIHTYSFYHREKKEGGLEKDRAQNILSWPHPISHHKVPKNKRDFM